jgi:hypothetical protein
VVWGLLGAISGCPSPVAKNTDASAMTKAPPKSPHNFRVIKNWGECENASHCSPAPHFPMEGQEPVAKPATTAELRLARSASPQIRALSQTARLKAPVNAGHPPRLPASIPTMAHTVQMEKSQ